VSARKTPAWLKVDNGTTWPRPALEGDEFYGPAHRAIYAPESLTAGDLAYLASVANAYGHLVTTPSAAKSLPAVRRALRLTPPSPNPESETKP
jgi:hypothetical protein